MDFCGFLPHYMWNIILDFDGRFWCTDVLLVLFVIAFRIKLPMQVMLFFQPFPDNEPVRLFLSKQSSSFLDGASNSD